MGIKHQNTMKERTWLRDEREGTEIIVYVVESPLTFGHSQLILKSKNKISEERMFELSATVITKCIKILKEKIPGIIENPKWEMLREYTKTSGRLIKILILKVSADETIKQYKVHLVPYFESHLCLTTLLFQKGRNIEEHKTGGMIHWLGEQEKRLDDQIEIWRDTCHFPTALIDSFKLKGLAEYLHDHAIMESGFET
jgi:hypothetical protein